MKNVGMAAVAALSVGVIDCQADGAWRQAEFALNLYRTVAESKRGNFVLSPYGVASVFSLLGTGTRGKTQEAFSKVLGLDVSDANAVAKTFSGVRNGMPSSVGNISDSIWLVNRAKICPEFVDYARNGFGAEARTVALQQLYPAINAYVRGKTHGTINNLMRGSPGPLTRITLVNTVYFLDKWQCKFDACKTQKSVFHSPGGDVMVQFMNDRRNADFYYRAEFQLLRLPYRNTQFEMVLILPASHLDEARFSSVLVPEALNCILDPMYYSWREVIISIPKFKFEVEHQLNSVLSRMGLDVAFKRGGDFSGISTNEGIYVSSALQKAKIRVDEDGTEAAAATAAVVLAECPGPSRPSPVEFIADRPFLFVIRNRNDGTILFMGRVTDPSGKQHQ